MFEFNDKQINKIANLREIGIDPYPNDINVDSNLCIDDFREMSIAQLNDKDNVKFAGRLQFKNEMGKIGFGRINLDNSIVQICIKKNNLNDTNDFLVWKKLDIGDWVFVNGTLTRTRTGELTVLVDEIKLYSKCLMGMPDKVHGLLDPELCQRMRYLDLAINSKTRETFEIRHNIIKYIRRFFDEEGYVEVETPILQSIPGGASARPFKTHHNSLDSDFYLRIAPELYLKRLLVGGFRKVFEIGKNFRNEGISKKHNPEFTMIEFYQAHSTYKTLMKLIKNLITDIVIRLYNGLEVSYGSSIINFGNWGEARFDTLLNKVGVKDPWSIDSFKEFFDNLKLDHLRFKDDLSKMQQEVFDTYIEPQLINPTFVTHYPTEISPLARKNQDDPMVTDRFELFIAGFEVANGFSELNDPIDQSERFKRQAELKSNGDDEAMYFDSDYIKALAYGMPPSAGAGIGIDRLVMLLTESSSIRDVILFPSKNIK